MLFSSQNVTRTGWGSCSNGLICLKLSFVVASSETVESQKSLVSMQKNLLVFLYLYFLGNCKKMLWHRISVTMLDIWLIYLKSIEQNWLREQIIFIFTNHWCCAVFQSVRKLSVYFRVGAIFVMWPLSCCSGCWSDIIHKGWHLTHLGECTPWLSLISVDRNDDDTDQDGANEQER